MEKANTRRFARTRNCDLLFREVSYCVTLFLALHSHSSPHSILRRRRLHLRPQDVSTVAAAPPNVDVATRHTRSPTRAFKNHLTDQVGASGIATTSIRPSPLPCFQRPGCAAALGEESAPRHEHIEQTVEAGETASAQDEEDVHVRARGTVPAHCSEEHCFMLMCSF